MLRTRGFTLVEVMVSLSLLTIGLLGVVQLQSIAAAQNGTARRASRGAAIARDFVETAMNWEYTDPRLAAGACGAGTAPTDASLGGAQAPSTQADFTASSTQSEGNITDGLTAGGQSYQGTNSPTQLGRSAIQLLWTVQLIDTNPDRAGCEAKLVTVVVRYRVGRGHYRNLLTSFVKYDSRLLGLAGLPEQI